MSSANLKDFRPGDSDFDPEDESFQNTDSKMQSSIYHDEINTLKIDKLSNRVTIISIIIPCIIGAILVFAYLDMKERVVDVDITKQSQVDRISQQFEEKLNALDVKIAKNKYDIEDKLPKLTSKSVSIEGQITKLSNAKADSKTINSKIKKLEKQISNNANQDKSTLQSLERLNKQMLSTIKDNQDQFDKTAKQIKDDINLFKEEFDARLLELSDYEQQIGNLRKDLSLLTKRFKGFEQEYLSQSTLNEKTNKLLEDFQTYSNATNKKIDVLSQKLTTNLRRFQKDLDQLSKSSSSASKPPPQINIDSSGSSNIEEESLTQ